MQMLAMDTTPECKTVQDAGCLAALLIGVSSCSQLQQIHASGFELDEQELAAVTVAGGAKLHVSHKRPGHTGGDSEEEGDEEM